MGVSGTLLFDDDWYNDTGAAAGNCPAGQACPKISMLLSANKRGDGYVLRQYDLGQYTYNDLGVTTQYGMDRGMVSYFQISTQGAAYSTDEPRMPAYWNPNAPNAGGGLLVIWPWNETLASFKWTQQGGADPTSPWISAFRRPSRILASSSLPRKRQENGFSSGAPACSAPLP